MIDAFQATLPWPLDPFQIEAIEKLEAHQGVLVSAPTSSGKTVIADYAVFRALETDARAIYTTPLKALSNQKYRDYRRRYGEGYVGLVTGENTINPLAPQGGIPRETRHAAQAEDSADFRLSQLRRPPENDLLPVVDRLRKREFLPAIYFIFSRRGCREALARCAGHGFDLTTNAEKAMIDELVKARLDQIADRDEAELYLDLLDAQTLRRGLAMHHAGLLPYLKELVEDLFQRGLIKVVFATETLSLGIHMPARACVVSSFTKFDGRDFAALTSGELTQLMGRAGRRGIDPIGHGVILKEPDVDIGTIFEAATGEEMTVESKFAPTYNMALNLLRFHKPEDVDSWMERSFGQFQKLVARRELDGRLANLHQRLGDVTATRFQAQGQPCCTERTFTSFTHAEEEIASLRVRMSRLRRDHYHGRGRRRRAGATKE